LKGNFPAHHRSQFTRGRNVAAKPDVRSGARRQRDRDHERRQDPEAWGRLAHPSAICEAPRLLSTDFAHAIENLTSRHLMEIHWQVTPTEMRTQAPDDLGGHVRMCKVAS
jgi:hypothetical protein